MTTDRTVTLEQFLLMQTGLGTGLAAALLAKEAIASTALAHPEWPSLDERRTWAEWEEWNRGRRDQG